MTEAYCLDSLEVALESYITPDRSPETSTVARYYCDAVLEDIYRKSLSLSSDLSLEFCIVINLSVSDIELTYLVTLHVYEDS